MAGRNKKSKDDTCLVMRHCRSHFCFEAYVHMQRLLRCKQKFMTEGLPAGCAALRRTYYDLNGQLV